MLSPVLGASLLGKAAASGRVQFHLHQIRDYATDRHRTVDEPPCGGGEGMVLKVDVLHAAWLAARATVPPEARSITLFTSPQGKPFDQAHARELAADYAQIIIVCGHYEGIDERFVELCVDREVSIGDFVLTGGEVPALAMADAITRLLPGVVGNSRSLSEETFENGLLKYPQYTRPRDYQGRSVPEVLFSGNHRLIREWRQAQSEARTEQKRPDLYAEYRKKS